MRAVIDARGIGLGATETGKSWCLKALHPAEPLTVATGIPDTSSQVSVLQNYQQSYTVRAPAGAVTNWSADLFFFAHPYILGCARTISPAGVQHFSPILNNQVEGISLSDKVERFNNQVERYRIAYMGITGYHNASAIANNGLVACAQFMQTPAYMGTWKGETPPLPPGQHNPSLVRLHETWQDYPRTFEELQNMPNAFLGAARDGVYSPYRLSETCQDWMSASDLVIHENTNTGHMTTLPALRTIMIDPSPPGAPMYPYGIEGTYLDSLQQFAYVFGASIHRRSDHGIIQISLREMALDASYTFYIRSGWEYQVLPGTPLVSFARCSPRHDPLALDAYYAISRELKDAYPADYNDKGQILSVIKDAAKAVWPVLSTLFPVLKPFGYAARGIMKTADSILGTAKPGVTPSAAAKEEAQEQVVVRSHKPRKPRTTATKKTAVRVKANGGNKKR